MSGFSIRTEAFNVVVQFPALQNADSGPVSGRTQLRWPDEWTPSQEVMPDWGGHVDWYLLKHGWSAESRAVISYIRANAPSQLHFMSDLMEAGMPKGEAEYLNVLLQVHSIPRPVSLAAS